VKTKRSSAWFVPLAIAVTCIPCLLIPLTAALIAGGALGGLLGFLGVPWVLALVVAVPLVAAFVYLQVRRKAIVCAVPRPAE
jgi:uncharacterized membrane protein